MEENKNEDFKELRNRMESAIFSSVIVAFIFCAPNWVDYKAFFAILFF